MTKDECLIDRNASLEEFKNQMIDFFIQNPIGIGVNWISTMEVSIRLINILVSFNELIKIDSKSIFNSDFHELMNTIISQHYDYIILN